MESGIGKNNSKSKFNPNGIASDLIYTFYVEKRLRVIYEKRGDL